MKKYAFTMLELIFVIVILGILAAIAVPKLNATRENAQIVKATTDVVQVYQDIISFFVANNHIMTNQRSLGTAMVADFYDWQRLTNVTPINKSTSKTESWISLGVGKLECVKFVLDASNENVLWIEAVNQKETSCIKLYNNPGIKNITDLEKYEFTPINLLEQVK